MKKHSVGRGFVKHELAKQRKTKKLIEVVREILPSGEATHRVCGTDHCLKPYEIEYFGYTPQLLVYDEHRDLLEELSTLTPPPGANAILWGDRRRVGSKIVNPYLFVAVSYTPAQE